MDNKNEKQLKIWFINQNSYMPEDGPHIRHYTIGKYLARKGYKPFVFAGNELHHVGRRIDTGKNLYIEREAEGVRFYYVKTTHYERNDYKRALNILSFYKNIFKVCDETAEKYGPPDIIYASSMYPTALAAGIKIAKKYGVKCICENRDLIPDGFITKGTFRENGLIYKASARWMRNILYKADALVFTMRGGEQYIIDHGWDIAHGGKVDLSNIYYVNNGVDLEMTRNDAERYILEDSDLDNPDLFKVVYFGAIRFLNQMPLFVDMAETLKEKGYDNIKILMWGAGTKIDEIQKQLDERNLDNIVLKGYIDKKYIPGIAKRASLFIATGNSCIVDKYGMSFNKLFDYLAGGKPIILPFRVAYSIVEENGAGVELDNPNGEQLANEVIRFSNIPQIEYKQYCKHSEETAKEFDYQALTDYIDIIIQKCMDSSLKNRVKDWFYS